MARPFDVDYDLFPEQRSFYISPNSDKSQCLGLSNWSSEVNIGPIGSQGKEAQFYVVEAPLEFGGHCRLESAKWPNYFLYESSGGWAYVYNYGEEFPPEALFLIRSNGDDTVSISSKKWPSNFLDIGRNGVGFWDETTNNAKKWNIRASVHDGPRRLQSSTGRSTSITVGGERRLECARRDQVDVLRYEESRRIDTSDRRTRDDSQVLIARWVAGECIGGRGSTIDTERYVRLDNQGDVWRDGIRYANLQIQIGRSSIAAVLVQTGVCFGMRRIRRVLCESLDNQCTVILTREQ